MGQRLQLVICECFVSVRKSPLCTRIAGEATGRLCAEGRPEGYFAGPLARGSLFSKCLCYDVMERRQPIEHYRFRLRTGENRV